jgi:hypothetical protein
LTLNPKTDSTLTCRRTHDQDAIKTPPSPKSPVTDRDKGTHDPTIIEPEFIIEMYREYINKAMEK